MHTRSCSMSYVRGVAVTACLVSVAGCEALLGPSPAPAIYALASIADVSVDPTVDFLPLCMPALAAEGRELRFLGDTIWIYPGGRLVHAWYQHSRSGDMAGSGTFQYRRLGPDLIYFGAGHYGEGIGGRYTLVHDGLIAPDGWCGPWRYRRVAAAP